MDIRPCPRCCKLVPSESAFCRRCGISTGPEAPWVATRAAANRTAPDDRLGSRWASTLAATATAAIGAVLALFAVSGSLVVVREGDSVGPPLIAPAEASNRPVDSSFKPIAVPPESYPSEARQRRTDDPFDEPQLLRARATARTFSAARKQSVSTPSFPRGSPADQFTRRNPLRPGSPEITSVDGRGGRYGELVTIRGSRLAGARQVLFLGAERGRGDAPFVVRDDEHLVAAVPDLGDAAQDAAVAVLTPGGIAVSVPAAAPMIGTPAAVAPRGTVCIVPAGDVFDGTDASVLFVESGAAVRASGGATLFVRTGGSAWGRGGGTCLLFCERGVMAKSDVRACDVVEVESINPCVVGSLFHYAGK